MTLVDLISCATFYVESKKTLEREALLKRHRDLQAEIAQHEPNLGEGEAWLPIEEQLTLKLQRFIEANIPELAGRVRVEIASAPAAKYRLNVRFQTFRD